MKNYKKIFTAALLVGLTPVALMSCTKTTKSSTTTETPATTTGGGSADTSTSTGTATSTSTVSKERTITIDTVGGNLIDSITGLPGTAVTKPQDPTKEYFTFLGWYQDKEYTTAYTFTTIPTENTTVYAKWAPKTASIITFNTNGGSYVNQIYGTEGDTIILPEAPTREGYTFDGWYTDSDLKNELTATTYTTESYTLYAKWTQKEGTYSITYHFADNTSETFVDDAKVKFMEISGDVEVAGWYYDEALTKEAKEGDAITGSVNLYASYYTKGLVIENGVVTKYTGKSQEVILPEVYDNKKVTTIGNGAFYGNTNITSVYIPSSITTIDSFAFYKNLYLDNVSLPESIETIGSYAFYGDFRLKTIDTLANTKTIGDSAFAGCEQLTDFTWSTKIETIGSYAFASCEAITKVELSEGVTTIGSYAFADAKAVKSITLPKTVTTIGEAAFQNVDNIDVTLDSENTSFALTDGLLTNASKTIAIKYFKDEANFTLPSTITEIYAYAFTGNTGIKSIDLTAINAHKASLAGMAGIEEIKVKNLDNSIAYYFGGETAKANTAHNQLVSANLKTVIITDEIDEVPAYAFYGINNLTSVTGVSSVSKIAEYAFAYTGFTTFALPKSLGEFDNTAFFGAENLQYLEVESGNTNFVSVDGSIYNASKDTLVCVPTIVENFTFVETTTTIKANAFKGTNIVELVIPDTVTTFEKGCLEGIVGLESLTTPYIGDGQDNVYMSYLFGSQKLVTDAVVDDPTTEKDETAARSVDFDTIDGIPAKLTTITISKAASKTNETLVPEYSFAFFQALTQINLPSAITEYGDYSFARTGFTAVTIPQKVEKVGQYAFAYCYSLETVTSYAKTLGDGVFGYNYQLETVSFGDGTEAIPDRCLFPYSETSGSTRTYYSALQTVNIASTVTSIGDYAFVYAGHYGDNTDYDVVFNIAGNSKIKSIGDVAFELSNVVSLNLPSTVETVGAEAFLNCTKLQSITFGNSTTGSDLKTIGEVAFAYTTALESLTIYKIVESEADLPELKVRTSGSSTYKAFYETNSALSIYVPASAVEYYTNSDAYKNAGIATKIKAIA